MTPATTPSTAANRPRRRPVPHLAASHGLPTVMAPRNRSVRCSNSRATSGAAQNTRRSNRNRGPARVAGQATHAPRENPTAKRRRDSRARSSVRSPDDSGLRYSMYTERGHERHAGHERTAVLAPGQPEQNPAHDPTLDGAVRDLVIGRPRWGPVRQPELLQRDRLASQVRRTGARGTVRRRTRKVDAARCGSAVTTTRGPGGERPTREEGRSGAADSSSSTSP